MAVPCGWLSVQHDWFDGFAAGEKVWVSAHRENTKSIQGYLAQPGSAGDLFTCQTDTEYSLRVCHAESGVSTEFIRPNVSHKITPATNPLALDITSTASLGAVSSGKDISIFECKSGIVRRKLTGHLDDVEVVKFFPSNMVLLSGGADMSIKIWSIENGSCPVTFTGHKRGITCLEIVDRGRNFVSASLDGTLKLWNCGTGICVVTMAPQCGAVNDISLFKSPWATESAADEPTSEVGTQDKLLASVTDTGGMLIYSLSDKTVQTKYKHSCELTACCAVSMYCVVAGSSAGDIITLDIRSTKHPLSVYRRSNYAVSSLCRDILGEKIWCSQKDGECYTLQATPLGLECDVTLSGGDCEPIYGVAARGNTVFTSSKDRVVRGYYLL